MLEISTLYDVKFELSESQKSLCNSSRVACKIEYSLESIVISVYRKTALFKIKTQE